MCLKKGLNFDVFSSNHLIYLYTYIIMGYDFSKLQLGIINIRSPSLNLWAQQASPC